MVSRTETLVGRRRELDTLAAAIAGPTTVVLVTGEAGIGKTRLVADVVRRARAAGALTLTAGCLPLTTKLPLLPFSDALRDLHGREGGRLLTAVIDRLPPYVRVELGRLLPRLWATQPPGWVESDQGPGKERLFFAVGELLVELSAEAPVVLLVEDIHWADQGTLDLLTYLRGTLAGSSFTLLITCRSDEAPGGGPVSQWLSHVRGARAVEQHLVALSRGEVAQQAEALSGAAVSTRLVDELYARAQGNPFMTEQLVAAALPAPAGGPLKLSRQLPRGLLELLSNRIRQVDEDGKAVLAGLAVAGRSLSEESLAAIVRLDERRLRDALRALMGATLITSQATDATYGIRHALLAEAVVADLLPGELAAMHARVAGTLEADGDPAMSAEIAGHWAAAGRPEDELRATVAAAKAVTEICAFRTAAGLWQRAIALYYQLPDTPATEKLDPAQLHLDAIDALQEAGGVREEAGALAEAAYARFAHWHDNRLAALVRLRVARYRQLEHPSAARPLVQEALRLFDDAPPSADHAEALLSEAILYDSEGHIEQAEGVITKGLQIATLAEVRTVKVRLLAWGAHLDFVSGRVPQGMERLREGRALSAGMTDVNPALTIAVWHSDALLKLARLTETIAVADEGADRAARGGRGGTIMAAILRSNAAEALLELGQTEQAGERLDPQTQGRPQLDDWVMHLGRADVDLRRGRPEAAEQLLTLVRELALKGNPEFEREIAQREAAVAVWAQRPDRCLQVVEEALERCVGGQQEPFCGELLVLGMRAAADLGELGAARSDPAAGERARTAAARLEAVLERMDGRPLADHPLIARVPALRLLWAAETARLRGASDPQAWQALAAEWEKLRCAHRAAYAWWRCAEAFTYAGDRVAAADPLRTAAGWAAGMIPLGQEIDRLAQRGRIALGGPQSEPADAPEAAIGGAAPVLTHLTERERQVLRLVAAGRTNAQIGAELFISGKTAGVHVTNILRKLDVTNRAHAAAVAERSGLLDGHP